MQFTSWFWKWLDNRKKPCRSAFPLGNAAKLSSLRLEDRRVLNVHSVLSGGALTVTMSSAGDVAKLFVVKDVGGNSFLHISDQANHEPDAPYLLSSSTASTLITSIDIKGSAGDQSVSFQGTNSIGIGTLNIHNSVEYVDVHTAINASLGSVSINASKIVQIIDSGSITAIDPHSSTDHLDISISAGDTMSAQNLLATGSVSLTATNGITVNNLSQTDEIEAGTGITVTVSGDGNGASFLLNSSADLHSDSGGVSILANAMDLQGTIHASGQTVSLTPLAPPFNPGSPIPPEKIDIVSNYTAPQAGVLELSAIELSNHITAGTLSIGDTNTGNVMVDAPITLANSMNLEVTTGGIIIFMDPVTTTTGNQYYSGPVVLGSDTALTTSGGNVTFGSTVDAMTTGVQSLTVNSGTGSTTFDGMVGALTPLNNLSLTCDSLTFGDKVFGTGTLSLQPSTASTPMHINDGVNNGLYLSSSEQGNIQSDWASLVFGNTGDTGGMSVGASSWASSVSFNNSSSSSITLKGSQTTSGAFTFTGPVTLAADITLTTTGGDVTIGSTVDGAYALTVGAGSGTVKFNGAVGGNQELKSLNDTGSGATDLNGSVTTTGTQSYSGPVLLGANARLTTTDSNVTFGSTIDGAYALSVAAGSGTVIYNGAVGGTVALSALNNIGSGTVDLNGNVTTTGAQKYLVSVVLGANDTLKTTNSNVTFGSTVDGPYALTIGAGSGTVKFNGPVGGNQELKSLNDTGSGVTDLNGSVTTTGTQTYSGPVLLGANARLTTTDSNVTFGSTIDGAYALSVAAGSGTVIYNGAVGGTVALSALNNIGSGTVDLNGNVTTTGAQKYLVSVVLGANDTLKTTNSNVTFGSTVDGPYALTVDAGTGTVKYNGPVGGGTRLASLSDTGGGASLLNGNVTTTGNQTYHGAVLLTSNDTLTSTNNGNVTFDSTVDGPYALTVAAGPGTVTYGGAVGSGVGQALTSLSDMGTGATQLNGNVTTTGNQTYHGSVLLTNSDALTSTNNGNVTFDSTLDGTTSGAQSLTISTGSGSTTFAGAVGSAKALGSVTVTSGTITQQSTMNVMGNLTDNG
ncbi:MAG: hypothetical protein WCH39_19675, partial [Schlesneria sp.]